MLVEDGPDVEPIAIEGARVFRLRPTRDQRGSLFELIRAEWIDDVEIIQWNVVTSQAGVLRGVHWHNRHHDLIGPVHGELAIGLADLRRGSPSEGAAAVLTLRADEPAAVLVPPGVAHGLYSPVPTVVMYGVSRYWDPDDEFSVRWDDPALRLTWPRMAGPPVLSERDATAPALSPAAETPDWVEAG